MTKEEKRSAIKRLNERLTDMARTFGTRSAIYKEYLNKIQIAVSTDNMHTPPKKEHKGKKLTAGDLGVPLITRSEATYERLDEDEIDALLSHHTAGRIKQEIKAEAKRVSKDTGRYVSPEEMLETWEDVYDTINEAYDEFYEAVKYYWDIAGKGNPRPSYMTIDDIIKAEDEAYAEELFGSAEKAEEMRSSLKRRVSDTVSESVQRIFR